MTMPMVRQILMTNTKMAQDRAIRELILHPRLHPLFRCVLSRGSGDFRKAVGVDAKGSGVYAVELCRSGLNMLGNRGVSWVDEGRGVNCRLSVELLRCWYGCCCLNGGQCGTCLLVQGKEGQSVPRYTIPSRRASDRNPTYRFAPDSMVRSRRSSWGSVK